MSSPANLEAAKSIVEQLRSYTDWLLEKIEAHFVSSEEMNVENLKTSFLETVTPQNQQFVQTFLSTQSFSVYVESVIMPKKIKNPST